MLVMFSTLFLGSTTCWGQEFTDEDCSKLYQTWVLNTVLERNCKFDGLLSQRFGVIVKDHCEEKLTEETRNKIGLEVYYGLKKDLEEMGMQALCKRSKPGYDFLFSNLEK